MQSPVRVAGLKQERANITVAASKCEFSLRMTRARVCVCEHVCVYANTCASVHATSCKSNKREINDNDDSMK